VSKDTNQVLGHADESDGIEEYDNPLPDWWLGLLYFTVVWAVVYGLWYHVFAHKSEAQAFAQEIAEAEKQWPQSTHAATVELTPANITAGEQIFQANCKPCHGADLHGGIGPNLVDSVWIHGGKPEEIVHTITTGVPAKGMPTWGPVLGPQKIAQVAAYVISKGVAPAPRPVSAPAGTDSASARRKAS
jgi:cytochrome c oxidase cbb3-type subunit 3